MIIDTLGGVALFLLGMVIMTESLRALAGEYVRNRLIYFTHTPFSGALTGSIATAILQSSSATTIAAVGFVSAGLISYSQSLGIIFGANIGTTITGWLVALIGFKLKLANLMLIGLFFGIILKLTTRGKASQLGMAIAGFSVIFSGISMMQQGMAELSNIITPDTFPASSFTGILQLVLLGIIITVITQSSSAGVAAALTALHAGAIEFEQAAALVIGMDVGTTFTAALATIGGSINTRRTGFSHVIYNLLTACSALILLTPYILILESFSPGITQTNAELALVGFHTCFNILGVILILPFTRQFERLIKHIIPDKADAYTDPLDRKLLSEPDLAIASIIASIHQESIALLKAVTNLLTGMYNRPVNMTDLDNAINQTHHYTDQIHLDRDNGNNWSNLVSLIHTLDHMHRLHERCSEDENRAVVARSTALLKPHVDMICSELDSIIDHINTNSWELAMSSAQALAADISHQARSLRHEIMGQVAEGNLSVKDGTEQLEAIRWLRRVSNHVLRIIHYQMSVHSSLTHLGRAS